jgi:hypothetical protein
MDFGEKQIPQKVTKINHYHDSQLISVAGPNKDHKN